MKEIRHDGLLYFQFEQFMGHDWLSHGIFSRLGGYSLAPFDSLNTSMAVPDERERVYANRRRVYGRFGRDTGTIVHAHLVHGATVARVTQADNGTWVKHVDGLITDQPGCALTMSFADCAPIMLYDPARQAIGLGHAGWRGAVGDLPGALARAMTAEFGSKPADLIACIGPCIGSCCYEVGPEVIEAVRNSFDDGESLLIATPNGNGDGRRHFDLPEANRRNLIAAGVRRIELSGLCTACRTDWFFSHRAERGKTGRFGAVLMLP